jgi:transposase
VLTEKERKLETKICGAKHNECNSGLKFKANLWSYFNTLSPELNPICYLLALLTQDFLHVSRIRVKSLTLR